MTETSELPATEQVAVLGRAAQLLASSAEFDATLAHTIAACLPALGDFGFFDVVVEGTAASGTVRRTARAYQDPEIEAILAPTEWVRSERTDLNLCALSSGAAGLHPSIDDAWYQAVAVNDGHLAVLRRLAFRSMLTVPMRYQGELVGALTLFYGRSGRHHTHDHRRFAENLAALAVPVVVNARLVDRHRRAEEALRHSEARLRHAADAGRLGLWDWDIAEDRIAWTDSVYEMHGVPRGKFGGNVAAFVELVHPEDRARVQRAIDAGLRDGNVYEVEFRALRRDGTTRWLSTRADIVRDAAGTPTRILGSVQDVTERVLLLGAEREARREAEAARRRLEALATVGERFTSTLEPADMIDAIGGVIVPALADWCRVDLFDDDGLLHPVFTRARTPALTERGGAVVRATPSDATLVGSIAWVAAHSQPSRTLFTEEMRAAVPGAIGELIREQELRERIVVPLVARGRTLGAIAAMLDRSSASSSRTFSDEDFALLVELARRTALALDNARLYTDAERARRDAESASRAKDEFLAILGHELRNPLAPIVSALELMKQRGHTELRRERDIIERQVAHLSRLVDDLLDVSRIVRGKVDLHRQPLDLATVVEKAIEMTRPLFEQREIELECSLRSAWVDADPLRLSQVVGNLLTNAAKFTPPHGRVAIELAETDATSVALSVKDTGQGISPELLPDIFGLFVQGPQALDRRQGGLGLGLAIVANLVALHGGKVEADSAGVGHGSTFVVRLPRIAAPHTSASDTRQTPAATRQAPAATRQAPVATLQSPVATFQSPGATLQSPVATPQSPGATLQSPAAPLQSPVATLQSPVATLQSPLATLQSPVATVTTTGGTRADRPGEVERQATANGSERVLLVDDNEDAAELLGELLRRSGYAVTVATSAVAALDDAARALPDLAILDIGLPGIDGYELAQRLRAMPNAARLRLIAVTGYGRDSDRQRATAAGFDAHLTKPVHPGRLLETLAKLLAR